MSRSCVIPILFYATLKLRECATQAKACGYRFGGVATTGLEIINSQDFGETSVTLVWFEESRSKNWKLIRMNFAEVQKKERDVIM